MRSHKPKQYPLIKPYKYASIAHASWPIQKEFYSVHKASANMPTPEEVIGIVIWNCKRWHARIKPGKAFGSGHQEAVLDESASWHEENEGENCPESLKTQEEITYADNL
jgi:hypothetical protein